MKNKWLIVLFIFFLGVILLSLLITQQSQKAVSLFEEEAAITAQAESRISPAYSAQVSPASRGSLPLAQSGVTIIRSSVIDAEERSVRAFKIVDKTVDNAASLNVASSIEAQDSSQSGITKAGKRPPLKEAQEMNSNGIVLY